MSEQNRVNMRETVNKLFYRQLVRFSITIIIIPVVFMGVYLIVRWMAGQTIWYGDEPLWLIFSWIRSNVAIVTAVMVEAGVVGAAVFFLRKPFTYLRKVLEAAEMIYDSGDNIIELPAELREAEYQLNQVKMELERNARAAKEAEQRKNDLIVYLAHDLKTPLTSVIGYLTLLRDENQISEELRQKYLSISLEKAEHLEDLINEFFEITRFNLSNLILEESRVNLTRMLEQISYEFQPMLAEKSLTCRIVAPRDLMIKCDVGKMQRVFDNLFRNAVNYSFEREEITFSAIDTGEEIRMACVNHGNTIPEEKLERIFEQFYRLDSARTTGSGGAGLGLAIAKEIVELHGGRIWAESENEEIRFMISIPKR